MSMTCNFTTMTLPLGVFPHDKHLSEIEGNFLYTYISSVVWTNRALKIVLSIKIVSDIRKPSTLFIESSS